MSIKAYKTADFNCNKMEQHHIKRRKHDTILKKRSIRKQKELSILISQLLTPAYEWDFKE